MTPFVQEFANTAVRSAAGEMALSVLVPFHGDDARPVIAAFSAAAPAGAEIVLFDDGAPCAELNAAARRAVEESAAPARLLTAKANLGRSAARNRLAAKARGRWLLFLDADMEVDPAFFARWLSLIETTRADALFGGYAPISAPEPGGRVHAALAMASDAVAASDRAMDGAFAVCSSNLAVRADAFRAAPFDEGYMGWGWEDVDWALSFAQRFEIAHVDNPAGHGGLETPSRLIAKFSRSGANFARMMDRHPEYAARKGARLALTLKRRRLALPARALGRAAALSPLPVRMRVLGLKLYRAGINAEALS